MSTVTKVNALELGGRIFVGSDLTNLKVLYGEVTTSVKYATMREMGASAGFQIDGSKTFTCWAFGFSESDNVSNAGINLGYGDDDQGFDSGTEPTNAFYPGNGSSSLFALRTRQTIGDDALYGIRIVPMKFEMPANKYPFAKNTAGASKHIAFFMWGIEE